MEGQEGLETLAVLGQWVLLVLQDRKEYLVFQDLRVSQGNLELKANLGHRATEAFREMMVQMDMGYQDLKDRREILVFQDILDFRVKLGIVGTREVMVLKAKEEEGEMQAGQEHRVILVMTDFLDTGFASFNNIIHYI
ncbi:hypothetical protein PGIGA_G00001670 [Pangasianodon gigas]|uniref:Uncharacterized protein n=1 Tax=Pangasianodon gigas TaxID=30993 RepID=A0ACC5W647_PANGG|nr:hypothetical protein [Pangasianodon gigas]